MVKAIVVGTIKLKIYNSKCLNFARYDLGGHLKLKLSK